MVKSISKSQVYGIGFPACQVPSGKRLHNYGKSPFSMGNSTISMAIFNSYVSLPEGNIYEYGQ